MEGLHPCIITLYKPSHCPLQSYYGTDLFRSAVHNVTHDGGNPHLLLLQVTYGDGAHVLSMTSPGALLSSRAVGSAGMCPLQRRLHTPASSL